MQNIVILAGNIGQDPETRTTQGGTRITHFTLNGLGKTVQEHCTSGMKLLVRGRIHYTKWTDQQGNDRYGCEIIALMRVTQRLSPVPSGTAFGFQ